MFKRVPSLFNSLDRFIRDSVVYDEFAYRIDRSKSSLRGYVEGDALWWKLRIGCLDACYPETDPRRDAPCCAPSLDLTMPEEMTPTDWRAFEHKSYRFKFGDDVAFPLMPGIPSGAYHGEHHSCTKHHISFGLRIGNVYQVRWKPLARADEYDPGCYFFVDADLPFAGISVWVGDEDYDLETIEGTLSRWFDLSEFASAEESEYLLCFAFQADEDKA